MGRNDFLSSQASHENIVSFYGAFYHEGMVSFILEFMDGGTLAELVEKCGGKLPENVLGKLTAQLLQGLSYLHKTMHIIHRDIKPQNILLNSKGQAKITDFGVSGELASTQAMAKTFVGTHKYMSPNRITGKQHSAKSDVWSLGLVVLEAALGFFPYGAGDASKQTFFALLMEIVNKPAPQLPADQFSPEFVQFIADCLQKEEANRPDSTELLKHPFILRYKDDPLDLAQWIKEHITLSN